MRSVGCRRWPPAPSPAVADPDALRFLAFYLPQFHPIPENDEWWGPGFTEWTNVVRGRPLFRGHYQPHLPADLGFCDLRLPETRAAQADLARRHGIDAFCYYHYWFGGPAAAPASVRRGPALGLARPRLLPVLGQRELDPGLERQGGPGPAAPGVLRRRRPGPRPVAGGGVRRPPLPAGRRAAGVPRLPGQPAPRPPAHDRPVAGGGGAAGRGRALPLPRCSRSPPTGSTPPRSASTPPSSSRPTSPTGPAGGARWPGPSAGSSGPTAPSGGTGWPTTRTWPGGCWPKPRPPTPGSRASRPASTTPPAGPTGGRPSSSTRRRPPTSAGCGRWWPGSRPRRRRRTWSSSTPGTSGARATTSSPASAGGGRTSRPTPGSPAGRAP